MRRDLIEQAAHGATVLTPNRRLARHLKQGFDAAQIADGRVVWASPDILPWGAWLERTYAELTRWAGDERLLSAPQELALWQQVIAGSPYAYSLLDITTTARVAREAAAIRSAWRLDPGAWRGALSEDSRAFLAWDTRFREICVARGWLDHARVADVVSTKLRAASIRAPDSLIVYGFDQLDPQQRELIAVCAAAGTRVEERSPDGTEGCVVCRSHASAEADLLAAAYAVRELLATDASLRIGVVVPDLARLRAQVMRVFDDVLEPGRVLAGRRTHVRPYNVSLGMPLSRYPLVHTALSLLGLLRADVPFAVAGALLRSPFLGAAEQELTRRALLDARLRRRGQFTVTLGQLRAEARAGAGDAQACPALAALLDACSGPAQRARGRRQLPSAWSDTFLSLLSALGWPGARSLDSEEYQTYEKWRELVLELSALDPVVGSLPYEEALSWLNRLSAETPFQPESQDVPVQVLGVLESAGIEFDHLFVTGLHDERWPAAARPNPLLPVGLQRAHSVPHASAQWELGFARRMTALWRTSARHVTFSYPSRDADRVLRATPLIGKPHLEDPKAVIEAEETYAEAIRAAAQLEPLADAAAPPLAPGYRVAGGAAVFRNQAACPFRAFAVHRLAARGLDQPVPGLNAGDRGTLVHRAAALLWGELHSHERLARSTSAELLALVERAADAAVARFRREQPDAMSEPFAVLERRRITGLLGRLLELEKQRAPFHVVGREIERTLDVSGLVVDARIDRIDALASGDHVILDYKTGKGSIAGWADARLDEPQLPLYAVTDVGEVAAVSLATVNAQEVAFHGLAREEGLLPDVATPEQSRKFAGVDGWSALFGRWREALDALAQEFLDGNAAVAPKRYPQTCEYCDLGTLCRVEELREGSAGGSDEHRR